jgi:hypothetical protein
LIDHRPVKRPRHHTSDQHHTSLESPEDKQSFRSFLIEVEQGDGEIVLPTNVGATGATLLLLAGEDSKIVIERLGRSSTRLTQDTYQHVLPGMEGCATANLLEVQQPQGLPAPEDR